MRITQVSKSSVSDSVVGGVSGGGNEPLLMAETNKASQSETKADENDMEETDVDDGGGQATVRSVDACLIKSSEAVPSTSSGSNKQVESMAQLGRMMSKYPPPEKTQRLVQKNGECNVTSHNVMKRKRKYLVDIFTTLVDMKWRYHLLMFALAFIVTWFLFGLIWLGIAVGHKDNIYADNDTWRACVDNVYDFKTALLFSIETQHTIGYGYRVIQPECNTAIFIMMIQSCLGLFIQSLITGIIFSKISRPKGRAQTIMFSQKAVICQRDGEYCLLFRVGDMRKSHIIGTSIRALLVKNRLTSEGESIPICQYPLNIETETSTTDSFVFLIWPVTVVHKINSVSPLWELSMTKLVSEHFEIIVILEGTIESTGMLTQVRTSYIPSEIIWGERLVPLMTYQLNGHCEIDYSQFHNTTPMHMSELSAKDYAELKKLSIDMPLERDYPVSFTAPAVRPKNNRMSVYGLFPRKNTASSLKVKTAKKSKGDHTLEKKANKSQNLVHFGKTNGTEGRRRSFDVLSPGGSDPIHQHQYKRNPNSANTNNSHVKNDIYRTQS